MDYFNYSRREANEVYVGATPMGGTNPIRIQSMTNTVTMDTEACVEQAKRIIEAGGEYVRLTTQGVREAENLKNINIGLRSQGYDTPLIADVHFNPKVAEVAALYAEGVRINPGNYVDAARDGADVAARQRALEGIGDHDALFHALCLPCGCFSYSICKPRAGCKSFPPQR